MKLRQFIFFIIFGIPLFAWGQVDSLPHFHSTDKGLFKKGNAAISSEYLRKIDFKGEMVPFVLESEDGIKKYGIINKHGKVLVNPHYQKIYKLKDGFFALKNEEEYYEFYDGVNGYIKPEGCDSFKVNDALVLWGSNRKWGALIKKEKAYKIIPAKYKNLELDGDKIKAYNFNKWTFSNGKEKFNSVLCDSLYFLNDSNYIFERVGRKGVACVSGYEVLPVKYVSIEIRKEFIYDINIEHDEKVVGNLHGVVQNDSVVFLTEEDYDRNLYRLIERAIAIMSVDTSDSFVIFSPNRFLYKNSKNLFGVVDSNSNDILPCKYSKIRGPFKEGIFIVYENNQAAIVDTNGIYLHEPGIRADSIFDFKEGRAKIIKSGKYGFIDKRGNVRVAPIYKEARDFNEGAAAILLNGKWGFIDGDENILVQPLYSEVMDFRNGLARCKSGKDWILVSKQGEKVSLSYDKVLEEPGGKWIVVKAGKVGMADSSGREQLAPRYEYVSDLGNNKVIVKKAGKWGVVDYKENFIIPIVYDYIVCNKQKSLFAVMMNGNEEWIEITDGK